MAAAIARRIGGARARIGAPIISKIQIIGNQRVEEDAIRIHITQQVGQPLDPNAVTADIKSIYMLGFFSSGERARRRAGQRRTCWCTT